MSETLIMVRVRLHEEDVAAATSYAHAVTQTAASVDGFQGTGIWQATDDELTRMILFSYASPEAATAGLVALGQRRSLIERQGHGAAPADVLALRVINSGGVLSGGVAHAQLISVSIRIAEPGYGPELIERYEFTFAELGAIPGYAGFLVGVNVNLEEEVAGFAAWDDEGAFLASLPEQKSYKVRLFERSYDED